jgi:hypothetical protein
MPICIPDQYTGLSACRCRAGKNAKNISAIQPEQANLEGGRRSPRHALAASISPLRSDRPRIGAMVK